MARPKFAPSPVVVEEGNASGGMPGEPRTASSDLPESAVTDAAQRDWLEERIREEYRDAAEEPLPPRLLALLRRLRPSIH